MVKKDYPGCQKRLPWWSIKITLVVKQYYPGGQKRITPKEMLVKDGTSVVRHAIKGMLPKNKLGAAILKNCYIFSLEDHDKEAQKPTNLNLNDLI